ncbi:MAG: sigma factor, partial [Chloroflexota bacterium]
MDDAALVQATLKGEASAFANLVQRYQARVYNLAYRIIGPADAEDAAQESFVKAYTQLSTYKPEHKFSNWLLSITAH